MIQWLRWRWFCWWHDVCPKHRTQNIGTEWSWCEACQEESFASSRAKRAAKFKKWGIEP